MWIDANTTLEYLNKFVGSSYEIFEIENLRKYDNNDMEHLLKLGKKHSFLGMLIS